MHDKAATFFSNQNNNTEKIYHKLLIDSSRDEAFAQWLELENSATTEFNHALREQLLALVMDHVEVAEILSNAQRSECLYRAAVYMRFLGQYQSAKDYFLQSLSLFEQLNDLNKKAIVLLGLGVVARFTDGQEKAITYVNQGIDIAEVTEVLDVLCALLLTRGTLIGHIDNDQAISDLSKALDIAEEHGFDHLKITILHNLGTVYLRAQNPDKAITYYSRGLKLAEEVGRIDIQGELQSNIGSYYYSKKDYTSAWKHMSKALSIARKQGNAGRIAYYLSRIGSIEIAQEKYYAARERLNEALNISQKTENLLVQITVLRDHGNLESDLGNWLAAIEFFEKALGLTGNKVDARLRTTIKIDYAQTLIKSNRGTLAERLLLDAIDEARENKNQDLLEEAQDMLDDYRKTSSDTEEG